MRTHKRSSPAELLQSVRTGGAACYDGAVDHDFELPALGHLCDVRVDHPRWSMVKRREDGSFDFVSPLPCPWNYGSITGWRSGDGDSLDAVVLGPRLSYGTRVKVAAVAVAGFLDDGLHDPKVICSAGPLTSSQRSGLALFFRSYAGFKGVLGKARGRQGATRFLGWLR